MKKHKYMCTAVVFFYSKMKYRPSQYGDGLADIGQVYRAPTRIQRGRGIGSVFAGLWKTLKPLALSGIKVLGKQALKSSGNIIDEMTTGKKNLKRVLIDEGERAMGDLTTKGFNKIRRTQTGDGLYGEIASGPIKRKYLLAKTSVSSGKRRPQRMASKLASVLKKKRTARRRKLVGRGGCCKKRTKTRRKGQQSGGGRRKKLRKNKKTNRRRQRRSAAPTERSIDIFDI